MQGYELYARQENSHFWFEYPQVVEEDINRDLATTLHWFKQNGIRTNPETYQALALGNTNHCVTIRCADKLIVPISKDIKLLSVTLGNRFNFDAHIADI